MAIGDVSDDDLTPPGWWSFVQPQTGGVDAPVVDPAPVADTPTPETVLPPPQPGLQFQEADTVQPSIPPVNGIGATDQAPPPSPPPPPMIDAALGAAQRLGGAVNAALPDGTPIAGTSVEPMSPMLAPSETAASPDFIEHQVANAGPLPSEQNAAGDKAIDERAQYLATHPFEAAKDQVMRQHAQQAEFNAEQYRLAKENEAKAQAEWDAHQRARLKSEQDFQDMNAKAAALANTKIDPKLHPGLAQGIVNVLAAAIGGAMSKSTGGRNLALEQLNKAIDDNIDAQKANLANQYRSLGMQREGLQMRAQREAEDYRDQTAFRIGMYQQAMSALQTRMQDFDPRGTQAAQLAQSYGQIAAAQQKTALDYKTKAFDEAVKIDTSNQKWHELGQKDTELAEKRAEWLATHGGAGVGAGTGAGKPDVQFGTPYARLEDIPEKFRGKAFRLPTKNGQFGGWVVTNDPEVAKDGQHMAQMYAQANYDLNEMQKLAIELEGEKTKLGSVSDKFKTTAERRMDALSTDFANTYGLLIHGRAPTAGVLEEVNHNVVPQLKSAWERGNTIEQIDQLRNDVDNRTGLRLQNMGANVQITSDRPHVEVPNLNTIVAPLVSPPVKGEAGYAHMDMKNFGQTLDQIEQKYKENPGLGGTKDYRNTLDQIEATQTTALEQARKERGALESIKQRTPAESERLTNAIHAAQDREIAIDMVKTAKKKDIEAEKLKSTKAEAARARTEEGEVLQHTIEKHPRSEGHGAI